MTVNDRGVPIRLVTFNVQHGHRAATGEADVAFLAEQIAALDADVVALQEVDRCQARSARADIAAEVADAADLPVYRYLPSMVGFIGGPAFPPGQLPQQWSAAWWKAAFRGARTWLSRSAAPRRLQAVDMPPADSGSGTAANATTNASAFAASSGHQDQGRRRRRLRHLHERPAYGVALLTRYPVREWRTIRLPLGSRWLFGRWQLGRDEPRAALAAVVDTPEGPLSVVCVHLSSAGRAQARAQIAWIQQRVATLPRPLVMVGDFNLRDDVPAEVSGWRPLVTASTFPRLTPRFQLDHVLADGGVVVAPATQPAALDLDVSDHRAAVVDLDLDSTP